MTVFICQNSIFKGVPIKLGCMILLDTDDSDNFEILVTLWGVSPTKQACHQLKSPSSMWIFVFELEPSTNMQRFWIFISSPSMVIFENFLLFSVRQFVAFLHPKICWCLCNRCALDTYRHHCQNFLQTLLKIQCIVRMKYLAGHVLPSILIKILKKFSFSKVWFYH